MSGDQRYYVGNFSTDARTGESQGRRRWIVGAMMPQGDHRNTALFELKYWDYLTVDLADHPRKKSTALECTLILQGRVRAEIDGYPLELREGDYVVIPPGVPNNLIVEVLEPASGITIKAPSDLANKTALPSE